MKFESERNSGVQIYVVFISDMQKVAKYLLNKSSLNILILHSAHLDYGRDKTTQTNRIKRKMDLIPVN